MDADAGLLSPHDVPSTLPRARSECSSSGIPVRVCSTQCVICGTRYPLVVHHIFNRRVSIDLAIANPGLAGSGISRYDFTVMLCPNCHFVVHAEGIHKRGTDYGSCAHS